MGLWKEYAGWAGKMYEYDLTGSDASGVTTDLPLRGNYLYFFQVF